jgi:hypothetical protein
MKIGIYTPQYPIVTSEGGVGTYTRSIGRALSNLGHEVHVLTPGNPQRVCLDGPVSIHVAPADYFPIVERLIPGSGSCYRISRAMRRLVAEQQLDIVEFANWEGLGTLFALSRPIPIVVRLHTSSREAHAIDGRAIRGPIKWDIRRERWQARMADALVTHSVAHQKEMSEELGIECKRIAVIPHGIPVFPDFKRPERATAEPSVVFLGRLETRKGTVDLLHAIPRVLDAVPNARFALIGKDRAHCPANRTHAQYLQDEFAPSIRARVDLLGQIPDGEVDRWLQTADVFVAPSLYESFGLVFLEAMRWGTAVIGTRAGGIPEIIKDNETGLLVEPHKPAQLAEAIISLLKNPSKGRAFGEAGRRRVESNFNVELMACQVENLYQSVIDEWAVRKIHGGKRSNRVSRTSVSHQAE